MANIRVCDQCGQQATVVKEGDFCISPGEWYMLHTLNYQQRNHLCSLDCVIAHAEALRLGEQQELSKETEHA
jgi:hypothetical protein